MIRIGMSTSCVHSLPLDRAFALAAEAGFDGVEVMVTHDSATRDVVGLRRLAHEHGVRVLSVHAPVLLLTQFVWGTDPHLKLARTAELAASLGAPTVVVHPPFRWQRRTAAGFENSVRRLSQEFAVEIAVENMFGWNVRGADVQAYAPGWDPSALDVDAATLDFSHAALAGADSLELAHRLGDRLRHVHLCDGSGAPGKIFDEHLVPGEGSQPVAEVLQWLTRRQWNGSLVAEVNISSARTDAERLALLRRTVAFAKRHTEVPTKNTAPAR